MDVLAKIVFLDENVNELLSDNTIYDQGAQLMGTLPIDDSYQLGLMLEGQVENISDLDVENYDVTIFLLDENGEITDEHLINVRE